MANADPRTILQFAVVELSSLAATGALDIDAARSPFFRPVVTSTLINLKDGMFALSAMGKRINETGEDIYQRKPGGDLTDLIGDARNAACHLGTAIQDIGLSILRWGTSRGPDTGAQIGDLSLGCPYEDDLAIYIGPLRVFMQRNLLRAVELTQVAAAESGLYLPR